MPKEKLMVLMILLDTLEEDEVLGFIALAREGLGIFIFFGLWEDKLFSTLVVIAKERYPK